MPEPEKLNATVKLLRCPVCGALDTDPPSDCDYCELEGGQLEECRYISEADVWAWVRERLLTDEAADACWEGYADARDEGEDEPAVVMRRGLAAAIDHAAAADQGKEGKG